MKTLVHTDKELIEATIKKCDICYVGLADTDGTPYVLPMNFGYRDGVIRHRKDGVFPFWNGIRVSALHLARTMISFSSIRRSLVVTGCAPRA